MNILEIKNLNYYHKSDWFFNRTQTLFDLNFEVAAGEAFGLLGANGAGKTTTIKCILDLLNNKTGTIKIFGENNINPKVRRNLAYIPEQSYFYDNITTSESLQLMAKLSGVSQIEKRRAAVLKQLKIESLENKKLRFLSKGQKQRVMLAQALIAEPKLLILDEPFSGLDPVGRKEFRDIFLELKQKGTALILCSHILSDVEIICDRVAILKKGRLCGIYEMSRINEHVSKEYELLLRSKIINLNPVGLNSEKQELDGLFVYIFSDFNAAQTALRQASNENIEIVSFKSIHGGLEDLFIKLISN